MNRIWRSLALAVLLSTFSPATSHASSPVECDEMPDSFSDWKLLDIHEDKQEVIRWFLHPTISNCRGIIQSVLVECKEYLVTRSVFIVDDKDSVVTSLTELRLEDGSWRRGRGVFKRKIVDVATGAVTFAFELYSDSPLTRNIQAISPPSCDPYRGDHEGEDKNGK